MSIFRERKSGSLKMFTFSAAAASRAASLEILAEAANSDNDVLVGTGCSLLNGHLDLDTHIWHVIHIPKVAGRSNVMIAARRDSIRVLHTRWKHHAIHARNRHEWALIVDLRAQDGVHRVVVQ